MGRFGLIPSNAKLLPFAPYYVTKDGLTVYSMISGKPMKQHLQLLKGGTGHLQVWLRHYDGTKRWHKVHRLVASLFVVNYKPSTHKEVAQTDNDKMNCNWKNLEWTDHSGSIMKKKRKLIRNLSVVSHVKVC